MGRINNMIKWVVANVNFLYAAMAVTAIVLAIFVLISNWGSLDPGFFFGWSIFIILFSVVVTMITYMGCLGVSYQIKRTGLWTGRRMLFIFQLGLIGTVIAVFYLTSQLLILTRSLQTSFDSVTSATDDATISYDFDVYENAVAKRFNEFYFSSITTCTDSKYAFFWGFIDDHCPAEMSTQNCVKCYDYSITTCPADESTCFSDSIYSSEACPYNICRAAVLDYLISYFDPMCSYLLFFGLFQFVLLLLNCLLICFTEKDTVEEMLIKSGTIGNGRVQQARPRRRRHEENDDHHDTESVGTSVHTRQTHNQNGHGSGGSRAGRGSGDEESVRNV